MTWIIFHSQQRPTKNRQYSKHCIRSLTRKKKKKKKKKKNNHKKKTEKETDFFWSFWILG